MRVGLPLTRSLCWHESSVRWQVEQRLRIQTEGAGGTGWGVGTYHGPSPLHGTRDLNVIGPLFMTLKSDIVFSLPSFYW